MKKRICFLAGFDANGQISDYVVQLARELSRFADVYYFGDFKPTAGALARLKPYCVGAYAERHGKYDFGSWQELIRKVGQKKISGYDELILVNDSCYGPLFDLKELFSEMDSRKVDFWGLTAAFGRYLHIQSYFVAFEKPVLNSNIFYQFFDTVQVEKNYHRVCAQYEDRLTFILSKAGFAYDTFIPYGDIKCHPYVNAMEAIKNRHFPFLKVKFFLGGVRDQGPVANWREELTSVSEYPIRLIEQNLVERGHSIAKIDHAVMTKHREGTILNHSISKMNIKKLAKLLLRPLIRSLDYRIDDKVSYQLSSFKKRFSDLVGQLDLPHPIPQYDLHDTNSGQVAILGEANVLRIIRRDIQFPLTDESEVLAIGRFSDYVIDTMSIDDTQVVSVNNEWAEFNPCAYQVKNLTNFYFTNAEHRRVLFDLIISQPLQEETPPEVIMAFVKNLKANMHAASVLVLAVPAHQKHLYASILSQANLHPAHEDQGLSVDTDPFRIYRQKVSAIRGYRTLVYKFRQGGK